MGWIFVFCVCFNKLELFCFQRNFDSDHKLRQKKQNKYDDLAGKSFQRSQHDVKFTSWTMSENRIGLCDGFGSHLDG